MRYPEAQNDMTGCGRVQDWFNHGLEHQISGFTISPMAQGWQFPSLHGWSSSAAKKNASPNWRNMLYAYGMRK